MTISELMQIAPQSNWLDEDGDRIGLKFLPGLEEASIQAIETELGAKRPIDFRNTMTVCGGIDGLNVEIDFRGKQFEHGSFEGLPKAFGFAHDGFGNYWYVDLLSEQEGLAQIFFLSHDPPELVYSYSGISAFLEDTVNTSKDPYQDMGSGSDGRAQAELIPFSEAIQGDTVLSGFAQSLDPEHIFLDLRNSGTGPTIDFGDMGRNSGLQRDKEHRIFAYVPKPRKKGLLGRLFGG